MANGKTFDVGSGLTDHRRSDEGRPTVSLTIPTGQIRVGVSFQS